MYYKQRPKRYSKRNHKQDGIDGNQDETRQFKSDREVLKNISDESKNKGLVTGEQTAEDKTTMYDQIVNEHGSLRAFSLTRWY